MDLLPVGDFSLYDHVLDTMVMLGAVPERYTQADDPSALSALFRAARGDNSVDGCEALEMSKWFDTNYHYIVPELEPGAGYTPDCSDLLDQIEQAKKAGFQVKPVLLGPLTFLRLGKTTTDGYDPLDDIDPLVEAYEQILKQLAKRAEWIELDEPILVLDMSRKEQSLFAPVLDRLIKAAAPARILLATYFGPLRSNVDIACRPGLGALHVDLTAAASELTDICRKLPAETALSLGLIDGRNVWKTDVAEALSRIDSVTQALGSDRVMLGTSCSLLHVPVDVEKEDRLDPAVRSRLAFAVQKCEELRTLARLAAAGEPSSTDNSAHLTNPGGQLPTPSDDAEVRARCEAVSSDMLHRSPYDVRKTAQQDALHRCVRSNPARVHKRSVRGHAGGCGIDL